MGTRAPRSWFLRHRVRVAQSSVLTMGGSPRKLAKILSEMRRQRFLSQIRNQEFTSNGFTLTAYKRPPVKRSRGIHEERALFAFAARSRRDLRSGPELFPGRAGDVLQHHPVPRNFTKLPDGTWKAVDGVPFTLGIIKRDRSRRCVRSRSAATSTTTSTCTRSLSLQCGGSRQWCAPGTEARRIEVDGRFGRPIETEQRRPRGRLFSFLSRRRRSFFGPHGLLRAEDPNARSDAMADSGPQAIDAVLARLHRMLDGVSRTEAVHPHELRTERRRSPDRSRNGTTRW